LQASPVLQGVRIDVMVEVGKTVTVSGSKVSLAVTDTVWVMVDGSPVEKAVAGTVRVPVWVAVDVVVIVGVLMM